MAGGRAASPRRPPPQRHHVQPKRQQGARQVRQLLLEEQVGTQAGGEAVGATDPTTMTTAAAIDAAREHFSDATNRILPALSPWSGMWKRVMPHCLPSQHQRPSAEAGLRGRLKLWRPIVEPKRRLPAPDDNPP